VLPLTCARCHIAQQTTVAPAHIVQRIAALSYTGDFRMVFGENPNKVSNIVTANLPHFHALYAPVLAVRCARG